MRLRAMCNRLESCSWVRVLSKLDLVGLRVSGDLDATLIDDG